VSFEHPAYGICLRIDVIDETGQRAGNDHVLEPNNAQLLILNCGAECDGSEKFKFNYFCLDINAWKLVFMDFRVHKNA
jgi:hypothetical protein